MKTLSENKAEIVAARRAGDDERAKELSQERQALKRTTALRCVHPDCGVRLSKPGATGRCRMHSNIKRFYSDKIGNGMARTAPHKPERMTLHPFVIEELVRKLARMRVAPRRTTRTRLAGRKIREALLELRISGLTIRQCAPVIGISAKAVEWHWAKVKRLCGGATDMAIAVWASATPKKHWGLLALVLLAGCRTAPVVYSTIAPVTPMRVATKAPRATPGVTLAWDAGSESIAGYLIWSRLEDQAYIAGFDAGNVTQATIPLRDLETTNYFVATAYNADGLVSPFSNEVSYKLPGPPRYVITVQPQAATNLAGPFSDYGPPVAVLTNGTPEFPEAMYFRLELRRTALEGSPP